MNTNNPIFKQFVALAVSEDVGDGDHSSLACIPKDKYGQAVLLAKEEGIVAGIEVAKAIFSEIDPNTYVYVRIPDGAAIKPGDKIFTVEGKVLSLLKSERLVLNVMQRMSGIATSTKKYVDTIEGTGAQILDTRKTTPAMRLIDKAAVRIGGGQNHRMGLYDMIMLKDNHIDFAGGIEKAVALTVDYLEREGRKLKIEVEARNLDEVKQILDTGKVDRIMLDNFTVEETVEAVKFINARCETESSGGITLETIRPYAECGVDFISVGALTHQIKSLDLSLKAG